MARSSHPSLPPTSEHSPQRLGPRGGGGRTLRENRDCAPQTGKEGSINYVLEVDFRAERLNIFPGQSGKWHGPQARKATACMLRNLPNTPWAELSHQHDYYAIAILATYPA